MSVDRFYAPDQMTSCYGEKRPGGIVHQGVDYVAEVGADIPAIEGGIITGVGYSDRYGNYLMVSGPAGVWLYGHMDDSPTMTPGDRIQRGDIVGRVGETGDTYGAHLHLALIRGSEFTDPMQPPLIVGFEVDEMLAAGIGLVLMLLGFKLLIGGTE